MSIFSKKQTTMIDIIIIICCVLGGFALGKYVENRIGEKGKFYQDLTRYTVALKDNVSGRQLELSKFNDEFCASCSKVFAEFLSTGKIKLRLSKSEKKNIDAFFDNLNCASSQALVQHIDYQGKILTENADDVINKQVAKASIYSKLGMLLGAMLGILLV